MADTWYANRRAGSAGLIQRRTDMLVLMQFMRLSADPGASPEVRAIATDTIMALDDWLEDRIDDETDREWRSLYVGARHHVEYFTEDPAYVAELPTVTVPPGSPIGEPAIY